MYIRTFVPMYTPVGAGLSDIKLNLLELSSADFDPSIEIKEAALTHFINASHPVLCEIQNWGDDGKDIIPLQKTIVFIVYK